MKTLEKNVVQDGWIGRVVEKADGEKQFLKGKQLPPGEKATPSKFSEETTNSSPLGDLRTTLRSALTEAGQRRSQDFGEAIDEGLGEGSYRSLGSTLSTIRQMTMQPAEQMFQDVYSGVIQERQQSMALLETFASDGTLGSLGDQALLDMSQRTGLDEDTLRGWRARVKQVTELDDEKAELEIQRIKAQISQSMAAAGASNRANRGGGGGAGGGGGFADATVEERQQALIAQNTPVIEEGLNQSRGEDGFVNPFVYRQMRSNAGEIGISGKRFDNAFATNLSMDERRNLGVGKSSGSGDNDGLEAFLEQINNRE